MKSFLPIVILALVILGCSNNRRDQSFANENDNNLIITLSKDGRCLVPVSNNYPYRKMQCTYKIDADRIQFFHADGSGNVARITGDCVIFSNVRYC